MQNKPGENTFICNLFDPAIVKMYCSYE